MRFRMDSTRVPYALALPVVDEDDRDWSIPLLTYHFHHHRLGDVPNDREEVSRKGLAAQLMQPRREALRFATGALAGPH